MVSPSMAGYSGPRGRSTCYFITFLLRECICLKAGYRGQCKVNRKWKWRAGMHHYLSSRLIYFTQLVSNHHQSRTFIRDISGFVQGHQGVIFVTTNYIQVGQDSRFKKNRVVVVVEDRARWHVPIEQVWHLVLGGSYYFRWNHSSWSSKKKKMGTEPCRVGTNDYRSI